MEGMPATSTASVCEQCGKAKRVLLAMVPGKDKKEWFLCPRCWIDGIRPMNDVRDIVEPADLPRVGTVPASSPARGGAVSPPAKAKRKAS